MKLLGLIITLALIASFPIATAIESRLWNYPTIEPKEE